MNNPKLVQYFDNIIESVSSLKSKKDNLLELLSNNGYTWENCYEWIRQFHDESEKEVIEFVCQAMNSDIIFDDPNEYVGSTMFDKTTRQLNEYNEGIRAVNSLYDDLLISVKEILEKKLYKHGVKFTNSLETTLEVIKQVYDLTPAKSDFDGVLGTSGGAE